MAWPAFHNTLLALDQLKMPESEKELQCTLGPFVFQRKHIPDFSVIVWLYDLLQKGAFWEWTPIQDETLQLPVVEATTCQALGHIHPSNPVHIE